MDFLLMTVLVLLVAILLWALTGDRESAEIPQLPPSSPAEEDKIPPEKTFRRRAMDKEIEEETGPLRRREDHPSQSDHHEVEEDFELPYSVDEIIPASSRFRVFRRTLLNSEAYARRGDFTTAISLYDGVKHRIADRETKYRIDTNIEYLSQYRQHKKEEQEERRRQLTAKQQSRQPNEVRFSIDGQVPQVVNIGMNDTGPEKIAELVSEQIRRELDSLKQDKAGTDRDEDLSRVENQLEELRNSMDLLNREKNRAIEELEHLKQDREHRDRDEIERLRNEIQSINSLKQELNDLNKRLVDSMFRVPEVSTPPVIPEARFTLDPGPILEILEKIPKQPKEEAIPEKIEPEIIPEELAPGELSAPDEEIVKLEESDFMEITDKPEPHPDETAGEAVTYPEELKDSDLVQLEGITDEEPAEEELMSDDREEEFLVEEEPSSDQRRGRRC